MICNKHGLEIVNLASLERLVSDRNKAKNHEQLRREEISDKIMCCHVQNILTRNMVILCNYISKGAFPVILIQLQSDEALSDPEVAYIETLPTIHVKVEELVRTISKKSRKAFHQLMQCLPSCLAEILKTEYSRLTCDSGCNSTSGKSIKRDILTLFL